MTPRPLRVAIVGAGMMGRVHAEACRRNGALVTAVSDPDFARATKLGGELGGAVAVLPLDKLLGLTGLDAVHVCTPPDSHYQICADALRRGLHVLCEKPIAQTAAEVGELLEIARSSSLVLCPVHQFPFQRGVQKIVERTDLLGRVLHLSAEMCTAGGDGLSPELRHQVALDLLPHPLSLSRALGAVDLQDVAWRVSCSSPGELIISGIAGSLGLTFLISTGARPTGNYLRVFGERRSATIDLFHGYGFTEVGSVSRFRKLARPFTSAARTLGVAASNGVRRGINRETAFPGLAELIRRFHAALGGESPAPISRSEISDIARARDSIISQIEIPSALPS